MQPQLNQKLIFFLWMLLACTISKTKAQQVVSPGITLFQGNLGLHQTTITQVYADTSNMLWVGTFGGLHRFNGESFQYIPYPEKQQNKPKNVVRSILQCKNKLVFSTEHSLFYYDYSHKEIKVLLDSTNTFIQLLSFANHWLYYFDFGTGSLYKLNLQNLQKVCIYQDGINRGSSFISASKNVIFLYDESKSLIQINLVTEQVIHKKVAKPLLQICTLGKNLLCLRSADSLYITNSSSLKKLQSIALSEQIYGCASVDENSYFLLQSGWLIVNKDLQHRFVSEAELGLPSHLQGKSTMLFNDKQGNLFVGKDGYGLLHLNKHLWKLNQDASLSTRGIFVRSLLQQQEKLWIGSLNGKLSLLLNGKLHTYALPKKIGTCSILSLRELPAQKLLIGSSCGLLLFNEQNLRFSQIPLSDGRKERINCITQVDNFYILGGTNSPQLYKLEFKNNVAITAAFLRLTQGVRALTQLPNSTVLAALTTGGLQLIDPKINLPIHQKIVLPNIVVNHILIDNAELILATSNGIWKSDFNLTSLRQITLNDVYCNAIQQDNIGNLWVSSNSGIYKLKPSHTGFCVFKESDGLQADEFNIACATKGPKGQLVFGGVNGLNAIIPNSFLPDLFAPMPILSAAFNAGEEIFIQSNKTAVLPEASLSLHLKFDLPNYAQLRSSDLAIAILPNTKTDTNWINVHAAREFYAQGLSAGNYSVLARAANSSGYWSPVVKVGTFAVEAVFYKQIWFLSLVFLGVAAVLSLVLYQILKRKRAARLAEIEQIKALANMRQQIADDIHDDLGAGLTRMVILTDKLRFLHKNADNELFNLGNLGRELNNALRQAIWATQPENDKLERVLDKIELLAAELLLPQNIKLHMAAPLKDKHVKLNPVQRQGILLIVKEACNNILKHSSATDVEIECHIEDKVFLLKIVDNGKGFSIAQNSLGSGLDSMARRAKSINASFSIQSEIGGPTQILIALSLRHEQY